jgi:cytochrome c oxidase subunit 1
MELLLLFMVMLHYLEVSGNWLVPILIGSPDMAFPRLNNNISFWLNPPASFIIIIYSLVEQGAGYRLDSLPLKYSTLSGASVDLAILSFYI